MGRKTQKRKMTKTRLDRYTKARDMAARTSRAIARILNGEPETSACRAENIDVTWLRRFAQSDISIGRGRSQADGVVHIKREDWIGWEDSFLQALTGEEAYAPEEFGEIFEECLADACTKRECTVMRMRYKEQMALAEIGKELGFTRERIRQIEMKALSKLRHPQYRLKLMYGRDYINALNTVETAQAEYDRARMARIREAKLDMERAIREVEEKRQLLARETMALKNGYIGVDPTIQAIEEMPLHEMRLSARSYNALKVHAVKTENGVVRKERIDTIGQLVRLTRKDLLSIKNLGGAERK